MLKKIALFCIVCFLQISLNAQEKVLINRKFNIELSIYSFLSKCEILHYSKNELAKQNITLNTGSMLRIIYPFANKHAIIGGLNYYRNSVSFNYSLDKTKYNLPYTIDGPIDFKVNTISLPISYAYSLQLSSNMYLFSELGYFFTIPLIFSDVSNSVLHPNKDSNLLSVCYSNPKYFNGFIAAMGLKYRFKKNELNIGIIANLPVDKKTIAEFTFFSGRPDKISNGELKAGFEFIGLKIGYVLTHKKSNE